MLKESKTMLGTDKVIIIFTVFDGQVDLAGLLQATLYVLNSANTQMLPTPHRGEIVFIEATLNNC